MYRLMRSGTAQRMGGIGFVGCRLVRNGFDVNKSKQASLHLLGVKVAEVGWSSQGSVFKKTRFRARFRARFRTRM